MNLSFASLGILGKHFFLHCFPKPRKAEIELPQTKQQEKALTIPWITQMNKNCQNYRENAKSWAWMFSAPSLHFVGSEMPALAMPTHGSGDGAHLWRK